MFVLSSSPPGGSPWRREIRVPSVLLALAACSWPVQAQEAPPADTATTDVAGQTSPSAVVETGEAPAGPAAPVEPPPVTYPPPGPPVPGDGGCVVFTGCAGEPETLWIESDGRRWHVGHGAFSEKALGGVGITEWVPEGETVHDRSEMVTLQWFRDYPSPREAASLLRRRMEARCPELRWQLLREEKRDVLYTWRIESCPAAPDQEVIGRILKDERGTHYVHHLAMGDGSSDADREAWIRRIGEARPVTGGRRTGPTDASGLQWQPWRSTPGVRLELTELERKRERGRTQVVYGIESGGFPPGKTYRLWGQPVGDTAIVYPGDFRAGEGGTLFCADEQEDASSFLCDRPGRGLDEMMRFSAWEYMDGEPHRVAVVSRDGSVRAYAKAFPFPLVAGDGDCRLELEVVPVFGPLYHAWGTGFAPDRPVRVSTRSGDRTREVELGVDGDGRFHALVDPTEEGENGGRASVRAVSDACAPEADVRWGDEVEIR